MNITLRTKAQINSVYLAHIVGDNKNTQIKLGFLKSRREIGCVIFRATQKRIFFMLTIF